MIRLVLDSSVLLSALLSPASPSAGILSCWRDRKVNVLTAAEQIEEIARVTRYPKIRGLLHRALAGRLVNRLREVATVLENLPRLIGLPILTTTTSWRSLKRATLSFWSPAPSRPISFDIIGLMTLPTSRRSFLEMLLAANAAMAAKVDPKSGMPTRVLGKTKARVSAVALGCGSRLLSYGSEEKAVEAIEKALSLGITYFDSAFGYGGGKSETWVGKALEGRRKDVFMVTKINERDGDKAMRILEESLKRLRTDHLDLIHIHSLTDMNDLAQVEAGALKTLYKLREQKVTRFIGVTSHTDPVTLKTALERHDFDCTQMSLNAALVGMKNGKAGMEINKAMKDSFEHIALPVALKKKMGVTAMKIFGQEGLVGAAPIDKLIHYSMSLPVATVVLGMPKLEYFDENIRAVKAFKPLAKSEMKELSDRLSHEYKASLDQFFAHHVDA